MLPAQVIPAGFPVLEERTRFAQLSSDSVGPSFMIRPNIDYPDSVAKESIKIGKGEIGFTVLPSLSTIRITTNRPYGFGDYGMIPTPGAQFYLAGGVHYQWKELGVTFYPDLVFAQNASFSGFQGYRNASLTGERFLYWNTGDNPERFGDKPYFRLGLGQSKISYGFRSFEVSISNQNIWWGPGQFNSLNFSNAAPGFPHFSINTRKPAKTFLGNFELQMINGIFKTERIPPTQSDSLNARYYDPIREKNRYINAFTLTYNPVWAKGLYFGASRTVQTFTDSVGTSFIDIFPVFWGLTKQSVGSDLVGQSDKGRSQQISIFGRYVHQPSRFELYFEFGKRDHALNWREFILNPEHARAYLFGFTKLIRIEELESDFLIRAEITHQQESVNRYIRYNYGFITGGFSWGMNGAIGGITHHAQPIGVGIGTGSNIQTLEISKIDGLNKAGIFFERLENTVDYYYKVRLHDTERKPWVDLSVGFLYDKQLGNLLLISKLQLIHARNYQWQLDPSSTPDFPKGKNLTSVMGQASIIYFWNKD
ncbi:MAG: hypothetical protein HWE15_06750 [Algoriphagus sp.]|uniref:capsule assembly Wzi family protein n=1 Tax=Algoriphagus sp. TaxID=1872435 RepID=UPI0018302D81|nr:capsule assembly Wzi family protein [Algoriphagus sp.]NVJ85985.1 hypothetical protein [Algoriphagus sp.]